MTTVLIKLQLLVFSIVTVVAVTYGSARFFDVGEVFNPPYEVKAQFATSGGIYPRADVDLLGTRVGSVTEIVPGPGSGTTVVMAIDEGVRIPRDVEALIGNKSAIGEQYVGLKPRSAGSPLLSDGDVIALERTTSPVEVGQLLGNLYGLADSIPTRDLTIVMREISAALQGLGPTFGRLIDDTDQLTRTSLENVDDLTALIDDARIVLDTQVDKGPETTRLLGELAPLTAELEGLDGEFAGLFADGTRAGSEVSRLLADIRAALPVLLDNLITVTNVAGDRLPAVRKTLTIFPWVLELGGTGIRPCAEYDPNTGEPIEETCNYDSEGRPVWSTYLAFQLPEAPGGPPYHPCTEGYEGTKKYQANGLPLDGEGAKQTRDGPPNMDARCTTSPSDPNMPNVRGAQNAHDYGPTP